MLTSLTNSLENHRRQNMENEDIVRELAEQGERIKVANKRIADL